MGPRLKACFSLLLGREETRNEPQLTVASYLERRLETPFEDELSNAVSQL